MMIAITLVAAIITGLLMAMRTGLTAYEKVSRRLEDNRRAMGLDQALHRQFGGMMPVIRRLRHRRTQGRGLQWRRRIGALRQQLFAGGRRSRLSASGRIRRRTRSPRRSFG